MPYIGPREKRAKKAARKSRQSYYFKNKKWNSVTMNFIASLTNSDTHHTYGGALRRLFDFVNDRYGKEITPDRISKEDIEAFLHQPAMQGARAGQPLSAWSVNTYLDGIRAFYIYCTKTFVEFRGKQVPLMRRGTLPTDLIEPAKTGEVDRDMTEDEVRAFLAAIDRDTPKGLRDYSLFWALLVTGRRRMEISQLLREDVERFEYENGRKGWRFRFRAKWRVTKEVAELPPSVLDALIAAHKAAGRDFFTMSPQTPLFPGQGARRPMHVNYVDVLFRGYLRKAGISGNIVAHSLRWENAWQRFLANGHNLLQVQEEMGWKSIEQCAHYVRRRRKKFAGDLTANAVAAKFQ